MKRYPKKRLSTIDIHGKKEIMDVGPTFVFYKPHHRVLASSITFTIRQSDSGYSLFCGMRMKLTPRDAVDIIKYCLLKKEKSFRIRLVQFQNKIHKMTIYSARIVSSRKNGLIIFVIYPDKNGKIWKVPM